MTGEAERAVVESEEQGQEVESQEVRWRVASRSRVTQFQVSTGKVQVQVEYRYR